MAVNVREVDRDQLWLMPPSVADWLPEDHLAFFVLDVVAELDLAEFYAELREDGRGGVSYDPAMMLAVLIYAYCVGERSSRRIERRLLEDVAFRVVAANQCPDHATLARFRARHQEAIAAVFSQVLGLCVTEGLVSAGVVSIDSTKIEANASAWSNRTRRQIAEEILAEAERIDAAEDTKLDERRGGELLSSGRAGGTVDRGWPRRCASSTSREPLTGRAIRPSGRPKKPLPGGAYPDASHRPAAERPRCARPTPPIPTAACSGPATASSRATTLRRRRRRIR
jgi:transposase